MKPENDIREFFRKAAADTLPAMDKKVLARVLTAHDTTSLNDSAARRSNVRSTIMRSPITKVAIAAAVVIAVLLGISQLGGSPAGVAWGEVVQKVDASPGVIFRLRTTGSQNINDDWPNAYAMTRRSPRYSRTDKYRGDQVIRTACFNLDNKSVLWLAHDAKTYFTKALTEEDVQSLQSEWTDPKGLLGLLMSHEYRKLGRKTIDGVVCEGIETTDPAAAKANFPIKSFVGRMWVSVETGYPVLGQLEITHEAENALPQTQMADQFQWDVEIGASEIEVAIPPDYRLMD